MALSPIDYSCALRAPRGILDRLRVMQESGWTLCPFLGRAFCPLSREATRGEGDLRILWLRRLGIRRRCGSRGRIDSKMRRVWFVNGTATEQKTGLREVLLKLVPWRGGMPEGTQLPTRNRVRQHKCIASQHINMAPPQGR